MSAFSVAQETLFRDPNRAVAARYLAADGASLPCQAVRCGGGEAVYYGPVKVYLERVRFDVLRSEVASPKPGDRLYADDALWTIQGAQPAERDALALKWSLDASWGAPVVWRSVSGSGASQSPPSITGALTLAAAATAGASVVSVRAPYAVGKLAPGDALTIGGADYTVTTTTQAASNVFSAVGVTPALAADAPLGAAVSASFARDTEITAAISGYVAKELQGGLQAGDIRLVLLPAAAAALPEAPKVGDLVTASFGTVRVVNCAPVYAGASVAAYEVQGRR